jgi:hypothetical protein
METSKVRKPYLLTFAGNNHDFRMSASYSRYACSIQSVSYKFIVYYGHWVRSADSSTRH